MMALIINVNSNYRSGDYYPVIIAAGEGVLRARLGRCAPGKGAASWRCGVAFLMLI